MTTVKLNDADASILESVSSWHRNVPSVPVTLRMLLRNGQSTDMYKNITVINPVRVCRTARRAATRLLHVSEQAF